MKKSLTPAGIETATFRFVDSTLTTVLPRFPCAGVVGENESGTLGCVNRMLYTAGGTEARNIYSKFPFVHAMMPLQMHLRSTSALAPISFAPRTVDIRGKTARYAVNMRLGRPWRRCGHLGGEIKYNSSATNQTTTCQTCIP